MRQTTIALLIVLTCTVFAAWFFATHEKTVETQYTGYRGEAKFNDFLAADMLLNELGVDAESLSSLTPSEWLPEYNDTIISRLSASFSTRTEQEVLIEWVANGGHLVLLPPRQPSKIVDEFLYHLGFSMINVYIDEESDNEIDNASESYEYIVDLDNTLYRIEIFDDEAAAATLSDDKGIVAARREWDAGHVSIIANADYLTNHSINDSDHARLLLDIVAGYVEPGRVWFIYDATFRSLWQVIWSSAPYVVASLAVMLVFYLWSVMPKFGPAVHPDPLERRSIIEHVTAAGHFVQRHSGVEALTTSATSALIHEAESRQPGISRLRVAKQAQKIAKMTGISAQEILDIIENRNEPGQREFTHNMQALQRIRKKL